MNAFADQPALPAAGGGDDHSSEIFAPAKSVPLCVYACVLSGGRDMSVAGWLRVGQDALESKAAIAAWSEFREGLHDDPLLNIRRDDVLRARKLAAGQGRPRIPSTGRGPSKAERWAYRKVLKRGLAMVATLPGTAVGTARSDTAHIPATAEAVLGRFSARHTAPGTSALAVVRTNTAASSWYDLTPVPSAATPPRPTQAPSHVQDAVEGLLEAAEFVAYCAYQHLARRHNRRFLWEWFPDLLPEAEGPLAL